MRSSASRSSPIPRPRILRASTASCLQQSSKPATAEEAAEIVRFAVKEKLAVVPVGLAHQTLHRRDPRSLRHRARYVRPEPNRPLRSRRPHRQRRRRHAASKVKRHAPRAQPIPSAPGSVLLASTIGGTIASGIDSPLRHAYGTARDFLLGAEFIDGTGALVKSGGRVVKNVTGYDLHKLLIGSLGTLAVITRLNFRTFPAPLTPRGFLASFSTHEAALTARRKIAESPLSPLTLDVINPGAAGIFAERTPITPEPSVFAGESRTQPPTVHCRYPASGFIRAIGNSAPLSPGVPEVLDRYTRDLTRAAEQSGAISIILLDDATRPSVWGRLREALALFRESSPFAAILKLNVLPSGHAQAVTILEAVGDSAKLPPALIARASGTLYVALLPNSAEDFSPENVALMTQEMISLSHRLEGRASLLFAPPTIKRLLESTLNSHPHSDLALMHKVKSAFDSQNIFAPGRLFSQPS